MIYLKYLRYLLIHKWFVMVECFKRGLIWRGISHDMSKLLPDEFIPYAKWFYSDIGEKYMKIEPDDYNYWIHDEHHEVRNSFDLAWLKHQKRNKHHWQYWLLHMDGGEIRGLYIPFKYIDEMYCDWVGAGKAIHGKNEANEWYAKNKEKINISAHSREYLESHYFI